MRVLDGAISVLNVAAASISGLGVPGAEPVIKSVLELATMVSTMRSNKEDLSKLTGCLDNLIAIGDSGCADDLKSRLATLRSQLNMISAQCKSLAEKDRIKRFVMGKDYKEQIGGIKDSIATQIQHFTVRIVTVPR
ncbi:hypothetical protein B0H16DRAFT_1687797 [Mycena metata]|uniref:Uncharacterized protein n=1 Tax=Mycena metata TaxID=1033252 RepID=A0AAD7JGU0_9AGAR|nr:hypothetical protein B0H16DRAFT_1459976 [Mycena metata]KAJ7764429.1 hypothetical protein B0H16DRAFT_1687797 [Mycena metata]